MKICHNARNFYLDLPLFRWGAERWRPKLSPTERTIAARYNLPPGLARVVCAEAGIGGRHDAA